MCRTGLILRWILNKMHLKKWLPPKGQRLGQADLQLIGGGGGGGGREERKRRREYVRSVWEAVSEARIKEDL